MMMPFQVKSSMTKSIEEMNRKKNEIEIVTLAASQAVF